MSSNLYFCEVCKFNFTKPHVIANGLCMTFEELVKHPPHYNNHPSGIECITIVQHHNFNVGNAIKYLWRQGLKDGEPSEKDLEKAKQYIEFELLRIRRKNVG